MDNVPLTMFHYLFQEASPVQKQTWNRLTRNEMLSLLLWEITFVLFLLWHWVSIPFFLCLFFWCNLCVRIEMSYNTVKTTTLKLLSRPYFHSSYEQHASKCCRQPSFSENGKMSPTNLFWFSTSQTLSVKLNAVHHHHHSCCHLYSLEYYAC